jgi:hypothetical protein
MEIFFHPSISRLIQILVIRNSKMSGLLFSIRRNKYRRPCIMWLYALKYNNSINIPSVQTKAVTQTVDPVRGIE